MRVKVLLSEIMCTHEKYVPVPYHTPTLQHGVYGMVWHGMVCRSTIAWFPNRRRC